MVERASGCVATGDRVAVERVNYPAHSGGVMSRREPRLVVGGHAAVATTVAPARSSGRRSTSLTLTNVVPARTSATTWGAVTARHRSCADMISLTAMARPAAFEPGPRVILVRCRTSAKVDSMGFVVRRLGHRAENIRDLVERAASPPGLEGPLTHARQSPSAPSPTANTGPRIPRHFASRIRSAHDSTESRHPSARPRPSRPPLASVTPSGTISSISDPDGRSAEPHCPS